MNVIIAAPSTLSSKELPHESEKPVGAGYLFNMYSIAARNLIHIVQDNDDGMAIQVLDNGFVRYVSHMGTDRSIVDAARISTGSKSDAVADKKLLMRLYRDQHTSPFEMAKLSFHIKMPIFVMRQFVRHRMQNLNEVSARYRELPEDFYIPKEWRVQDKANRQHTTAGEVRLNGTYSVKDVDGSSFRSNDPSTVLMEHCKMAYALYKDMLNSGAGREMARFCLPLNIMTEVICCWDMKNLVGFFRLRLDEHAQLEIQAYAAAMYEVAKRFFPWTIEAYDRFPIMTHDREDARV